MPKNPKVNVNVPLRSGFDKSHHSLLTAKVGTLVPILVDEVMGNSKMSLRLALAANLPPLATDTFMKASVRVEAFFVPMRLCYKGWEDFYCDNQARYVSSGSVVKGTNPKIPVLKFNNNYDATNYPDLSGLAGPGSLADYLGLRGDFCKKLNTGVSWTVSALPFIAYHLIYDNWYRANTIQNPCFLPPQGNTSTPSYTQKYCAATVPYSEFQSSQYPVFEADAYLPSGGTIAGTSSTGMKKGFLADEVHIAELRQRNFGFDYFTNAQPDAAYRGDVTIAAVSDFTIASLRAGNSLQMWRERNALAGTRYADVLAARTGANLNDGVAQRPIFLGSAVYPFFSRSVQVTGDNTNANNPFAGAAGGEVGRAYASGSDFIIDNFTANEPGYVFVIASLVPHVTYSSGCRRYLKHYDSLTDFADPIFQNIGNQPIAGYELQTDSCADGVTQITFGYTDRYAEYMTIEDQVHGLVSEGQSLASFASQRYIDGTTATINTDFLQIPTDYFDDITVVQSTISDYGCWMDCDFQYHVSMPLAEYSMPSLQDPAYEHGQKVTIHRGGFRL